MTHPAGIAVIGDLVRSHADGRPGGADRPPRWPFVMFKRQF
jgi:hypothetical protein